MATYRLITTKRFYDMPKGTLLDTINVPKLYQVLEHIRKAGRLYSPLSMAFIDDEGKIIAETYFENGRRVHCMYIHIGQF